MVDTLDILTADLQQYVVAPLNAFGLGGFLFDVEGESIANLDAEITDHYAEDNRALQDHIAIRPRRITLKGYVGEQVYRKENSDNSILAQAVQKLTTVSAYLPQLSAAATQVQQVIDGASPSGNISLNDAADIYGLVQNVIQSFGPQSAQQKAYNYFKSLQSAGVLFAIQTPWEFLTSMAIENITAIQDEKTKGITDFSIRLKQIRIAKTKTTAYKSGTAQTGDASGSNTLGYTGNYPDILPVTTTNLDGTPSLQGAAAIQGAVPVEIGNVPGVSLPSNLLQGSQSYISQASDLVSNPNIKSVFVRAGAQ